MYDFLDKHKRAVQIVLAMVMLPFMFFGVDYYFSGGGADEAVATVGGEKITRREFDEALRDQGERLRQSMGRNFDPAMLDNADVRYAVVENLVNQRLLAAEASRERFRISDEQLAEFIAKLPAFQEEGKFSPERYRILLQGQNMTPAMFEARVRRDLAMTPLQEPISAGSIVARMMAQEALRHNSELLEDTVTALKVLLRQRDEEKAEFEEGILNNLKLLVYPYLNRLKSGRLSPDQAECLLHLESRLEGITSQFVGRLSKANPDLTPTEIKVADLIRDGRTSKEIATLLNLSEGTIMFHRENIRKKLDLQHTRVNLASYLRSLG